MNSPQYRIIESLASNQLSEKVNEAMNEGWKCLGGPQIQQTHNDMGSIIALRFFQAMTKAPESKIDNP